MDFHALPDVPATQPLHQPIGLNQCPTGLLNHKWTTPWGRVYHQVFRRYEQPDWETGYHLEFEVDVGSTTNPDPEPHRVGQVYYANEPIEVYSPPASPSEIGWAGPYSASQDPTQEDAYYM